MPWLRWSILPLFLLQDDMAAIEFNRSSMAVRIESIDVLARLQAYREQFYRGAFVG